MYRSFREMPVWIEAMDIGEEVFKLSEKFPRKETYGLSSQVRRSALSISANIAEAFGRKHNKDKMSFYIYSRGSIAETQSHLEYARRVGYLSETEVNALAVRLDKLTHDLNKILLTLRRQLDSKSQS